MKIRCNEHHRFTTRLGPVPSEDIARCPYINTGEDPRELVDRIDIPESIRLAIAQMPWRHDRYANAWAYVRPQLCKVKGPDDRSGSFLHVDVDSIYRAVAPSWDPNLWRVMIVSFGDIAETEFVSHPFDIQVDDRPRLTDYVNLAEQANRLTQATHSPAPGQVTEYTIRDFHRAGPIRRDGWRLAIVSFETNEGPSPTWPPAGRE